MGGCNPSDGGNRGLRYPEAAAAYAESLETIGKGRKVKEVKNWPPEPTRAAFY